jgi:hypothetical protein
MTQMSHRFVYFASIYHERSRDLDGGEVILALGLLTHHINDPGLPSIKISELKFIAPAD